MRRVYLGKERNDWYALGGKLSEWHSEHGFGESDIDGWCSEKFDKYVTLKQGQDEVYIPDGKVFRVTSAAVNLVDGESPIGLALRIEHRQVCFMERREGWPGGWRSMDFMYNPQFNRLVSVKKKNKIVKLKKDALLPIESIVVKLGYD